MEKTKMYYACLARVVREGGFKVALIARLSAIPGHCMSSYHLAPFISLICDPDPKLPPQYSQHVE